MVEESSFSSVNTALSVKVVVIGYVAVGKTCILNRYINNVFTSDPPSTNGASYSCKVLNFDEYNQNIKFDIWDTSGQERFRSLNKIFYRDAKIGILVYDITNKESFNELTSYWYNQIKDEAPEGLGNFLNKCLD